MTQQEIKVNDPEALRRQARRHYEMRDFFREMASGYEARYDTIVGQLDSSQVGRYQQWWSALRARLLREADLHDQSGRHLEIASDAYTTVEAHTTPTFTPHSAK